MPPSSLKPGKLAAYQIVDDDDKNYIKEDKNGTQQSSCWI